MNKKGFTLIELLAVIVILAIIALIAVPIVLGIIEDARKSATLRSAEFYLDGVEQAVARAMLNGVAIDSDKQYPIMKSGDICLGNYVETDQDGKESCKYEDGKDATLKVEVDGQKPTDGTITLSSGAISKATLKLNNEDIELKEGKLDYIGDFSVGEDDDKESLIGKAVLYDPEVVFPEEVSNYEELNLTNWHIIGETDTTVDLLNDENSGGGVGGNNWETVDNGPIISFFSNSIYTGSKLFLSSKFQPIPNFTYVNNQGGTAKEYGYQKIEIKNGVTTITNKEGTQTTLEAIAYFRLPTLEELLNVASVENPNIKQEALEALILRNLSALKELLKQSIDMTEDQLAQLESIATVDQIVEFFKTNIEGIVTENKQLTLYNIANACVNMNIEPDYDLTLPTWLYDNIEENSFGSFSNYVTMTTEGDSSLWAMYAEGFQKHEVVNNSANGGFRWVTTVPKSDITVLD